MKSIFFLFTIVNLLFIGCSTRKEFIYATIRGNVKNIPAKKLYLTEAHQWQVFLDSSIYVNDSFSFQKKFKDEFVPFVVSLAYIDTVDGKTKTLYFRNHVLSPPPDSTRYVTNFFVLDSGVTLLSGIHNSYNRINVSSRIETNAMFKTQMIDFGFISGNSKNDKKKMISEYSEIIKQYPSSQYLLRKLLENREIYTSAELLDYLTLFDQSVQKSEVAISIYKYSNQRPDVAVLSGMKFFSTDKGNIRSVVDTTAKVNMLVFWASWCAPCRAEIPWIKQLYNRYKDRGLSISSISIDEDKSKWESVLQSEEMPWSQFIVNSSDIEKIKKQYDFSAIPLTILADKRGNVISRSIGLDFGQSNRDKRNILDSLLNN